MFFGKTCVAMFLPVHVLLDVDHRLEGLEESDPCLLESLIFPDLQLRVMTYQARCVKLKLLSGAFGSAVASRIQGLLCVSSKAESNERGLHSLKSRLQFWALTCSLSFILPLEPARYS
jgi:hypothetical protein